MHDSFRYDPATVAMVINQLSPFDLDYIRELSIKHNLDYEKLVDAFSEVCLDYIAVYYHGLFSVSRAATAVRITQEEQVFSVYHCKNQGG